MKRCGRAYAAECHYLYKKPLTSLGYNLEGFLTNLTGICDILLETPAALRQLSTKNDVPNLLCNKQGGRLVLHLHTNREPMRYFLPGIIEGTCEHLFARNVKMSSCACKPGILVRHRYYFKYTIVEGGCIQRKISSITSSFQNSNSDLSTNETQNVISPTVHRLDQSRIDKDFNRTLPYKTAGLPENSTIRSANCDESSKFGKGESCATKSRSTSDIDRYITCAHLPLKLNNNTPRLESSTNISSSNDCAPTELGLSTMSKVRLEEEVYAKGLLEDSLQKLSNNVHDSKMNVASFCTAFPWHFVCDRNMKLKQMGTAMIQVSIKIITLFTSN